MTNRSTLVIGAAPGFGRVLALTQSNADAAATKGFLNFVESATPEVNGRFFDLFNGEIPW